jgi:hypothetical protein
MFHSVGEFLLTTSSHFDTHSSIQVASRIAHRSAAGPSQQIKRYEQRGFLVFLHSGHRHFVQRQSCSWRLPVRVEHCPTARLLIPLSPDSDLSPKTLKRSHWQTLDKLSPPCSILPSPSMALVPDWSSPESPSATRFQATSNGTASDTTASFGYQEPVGIGSPAQLPVQAGAQKANSYQLSVHTHGNPIWPCSRQGGPGQTTCQALRVP